MARRRPPKNSVRPGAKPALKPTNPARLAGAARRRVGRRALITIATVAVAALLLALVLIPRFATISPARLRAQADAATQAADWPAALKAWRAYNATSSATAESFKQEARACLTLGLAAQAERSLRLATTADPADSEAWRLILEILRVEDRPVDAQTLGWQAYDAVPPRDRPGLLKQLTLALLTDVPDDIARATLNRWISADPSDVDARVALTARIAAQPRASDPGRDSRLAQLESILKTQPDHIATREALVTALLDAGEPDQGLALLDSWPQPFRDARYWRLQGRYLLDHAKQSELAVHALQSALASLPQDWRSWYRLARALRASRHSDGSDLVAAQTVARIRETLDPITLVPRLDAAFDHLDQSSALLDLAALCDRVGLSKLAAAWRAQVAPHRPSGPIPFNSNSDPNVHSQLRKRSIYLDVVRSPRSVAQPKHPLLPRQASTSRPQLANRYTCVQTYIGSISNRTKRPINHDRIVAMPPDSGKPQGCRSIHSLVRWLEQNHETLNQPIGLYTVTISPG